MRLRIRALPSHCKKALPRPPVKEGRRSAKRRNPALAASSGCGSGLSADRSPFGAPPRLLPEARKPTGSAPGHASWDVAPAGVTRLHLSQSRDCTSRTGRSTGVTDAQSRPGAACNAARRNRSRSTFESTLAKGPSANEITYRNQISDESQGRVSETETVARTSRTKSGVPCRHGQISTQSNRGSHVLDGLDFMANISAYALDPLSA